MALKLITANTALPVALADMKTSLRIDGTERDTEITWAIKGAGQIAAHESGRQIMQETFELTLDAFPEALELTRVPVSSVTSLKYTDTTGSQITMSSALYLLDTADDFGSAYVVPVFDGTWPDTREVINAVVIRYVAGYAATSADVSPVDVARINSLMALWVDDPTSLYDRLSAINRVFYA